MWKMTKFSECKDAIDRYFEDQRRWPKSSKQKLQACSAEKNQEERPTDAQEQQAEALSGAGCEEDWAKQQQN